MSDSNLKFEVKREVQQFGIGDNKRKYIVVTTNFATARQVFSPERYRAETGLGEQRELVMSHVRNIRKEIEDGNFTPTAVSASVRPNSVVIHTEENGVNKVCVRLDDGESFPLTDGGHRFGALELILEMTKDENVKKDIEASSVTALIMLDGNSKKDFLNLQKGRPVDKSHIQSLSIQEKLVKAKDVDVLTFAYNTAKLLNTDVKSPFFNQIRFDSAGVSGLPISSLIGKGASDIAASIVGGAKVAIAAKQTPEWLAKCIITAYVFVKDRHGDLFESGRKLCPPPNGTKGSATMLIGIGNVLAYRLKAKGTDVVTPADIDVLAEACNLTFKGNVNGNFSGPIKRDMMGKVAEFATSDLPGERHYGVLMDMVNLFGSTSTFSLPKKTKEPRVPKPKVPKAPKELVEGEEPKKKKPKASKKPKAKEVKENEEQMKLFDDDTDFETPEGKVEPKFHIQTIDDQGEAVYTVDTKEEEAPWEKTEKAPWEIDS